MNMPAGQADANELHSLVDKDMNFGILTAARHSYCLVLPCRASTLMYFAKCRIDFK